MAFSQFFIIYILLLQIFFKMEFLLTNLFLFSQFSFYQFPFLTNITLEYIEFNLDIVSLQLRWTSFRLNRKLFSDITQDCTFLIMDSYRPSIFIKNNLILSPS
jgi:hypothetical protein